MSIVLAILEGKDVGREFVFERLPILVGRTDACNVVLYHPSISRHHCRFYQEDNRVFIEDLRSVNGTFVNGVPVILNSVLGPGDIVGLGALKFRFDTLQAPGHPTPLPLPKRKTKELFTFALKPVASPLPLSPLQETGSFRALDAHHPAFDNNLGAEKLAAEKLAAEKLAAEKLAAEKLAAEKLAAEKLAAEKLAAEKLAAEKLAAEKLAAEKQTEEERLLEAILPEEIEGILPEEALSPEEALAVQIVGKCSCFEDRLPEEVLAEETLAKANAADNIEDFCWEKPPEAVGAKKAWAQEMLTDKIALFAREKLLEPVRTAEVFSDEEIFSVQEINTLEAQLAPHPDTPSNPHEQALLAQISAEQQLLQALDMESLEKKRPPFSDKHPALGPPWLQPYIRYMLAHPFLFTGLGCLLCVLLLLFFTN